MVARDASAWVTATGPRACRPMSRNLTRARGCVSKGLTGPCSSCGPTGEMQMGRHPMAETATATAPLTWDAATRLVRAVEDAFGAADLSAIEQCFTVDAVARFADFPEMVGREAIMRFLHARFARTRGYRLKKTLHCLMGDVL